MKHLLAAVGLFSVLISGASAQQNERSLFDRNRDAIDRAEKRNFEPPPRNEGRTGYTERNEFRNNSGNDNQSRQLDRLDREPNSSK